MFKYIVVSNVYINNIKVFIKSTIIIITTRLIYSYLLKLNDYWLIILLKSIYNKHFIKYTALVNYLYLVFGYL